MTNAAVLPMFDDAAARVVACKQVRAALQSHQAVTQWLAEVVRRDAMLCYTDCVDHAVC